SPLPRHATAPTHLHTLSLHDALPISSDFAPRPGDELLIPATRRGTHGLVGDGDQDERRHPDHQQEDADVEEQGGGQGHGPDYRQDRKSTRLNSSHVKISYAVFCLKKK